MVHVLEESILGRAAPGSAPGALDLVDVVAQSDEQVEEELRPAVEHLGLHGAAALEGGAAADDEGEVVVAQLGIRVGCVGVGIACGREDCVALDAGSEPLLAQSDALQVIQAVLVGSTIDDRVLQQLGAGSLVENGGLVVALDLPGIAPLVVDQSWGVVILVQVLEDRREDLGLLIRDRDALARWLHVL